VLQFLTPDPLLILFLEYAVNGSAIPDVDFDIGESYAGLMPIDSAAGSDNSLYFWFFPSENPEACDEILIWLNGGVRNSSATNLIRLLISILTARLFFPRGTSPRKWSIHLAIRNLQARPKSVYLG
jgi:hypothetical protein